MTGATSIRVASSGVRAATTAGADAGTTGAWPSAALTIRGIEATASRAGRTHRATWCEKTCMGAVGGNRHRKV